MKNAFCATLSLLLAASAASTPLQAAVPNRLSNTAVSTAAADLPQGVSPRVRTSTALGHLSGDTPLDTLSLVLPPSADQTAALDQLLADQQNPASESYHQWLTPEQFGERFGASDHDLHVLENWLTSQGLQVLDVPASRNRITFSGNAATVESAFHTQLTRFSRNGREFFENTTAPQLPTGLQTVVSAVTGLSSYRLEPQAAKPVLRPDATATGISPNATSTNGLSHYIAPYDFRQIYNAAPLYNSGQTGAGIKIAVIGQSAVDTQQLAYFQTLTGQTVKAPTLVLMPNSGTSTRYSGDEGESEADLEYASGVAPGASVYFVYTGSSTSVGVIDALEYAITNNTANILTLSYGGCETANTLSTLQGIETYLRQANAQGQTILVSSGDSGAAGCDTTAPTAYDGLQVSYPASSPYVSAIGGTILVEGTSTGYWSSTNNSQLGSALSYIPESTWNETTSTSLSASGGGFSRYFSKPGWQTGTGVPADGARDMPDVSFSAAAGHDAYLVCTSDTAYQGTNSSGTKVTGACTSTTLGAYVVGGTSLATPSFAGGLAMVAGANGLGSLGNVNPLLYRLAATTPAIFHDITSGNNNIPCASGTLGCVNGTLGYSATTGYDLATGLGSVDIAALSAGVAATLKATSTTPTVGITVNSTSSTAINVTLRVSSSTTTTVPTGTVAVTVDGGAAQTFTLSGNGSGNAAVTGTLTSTTGFAVGTHTIVATYSGDANFTTASGTAGAIVTATTGAITLVASPSTLTIATATATRGSWTLTLTSNNSFSGFVSYSYKAASGSATPSSGCFLGQGDVGIPANGSINTTITYTTLASDCTSTGAQKVLAAGVRQPVFSATPGSRPLPLLAVGFTGLLGSALLRRRRAWMTGLLALTFATVTMGLSGCGSGGTLASSTTTTTATKGTYNLIFTATATGGTVTASTPVTLVIQ